ncbi:MAG: bifunctional metallophosphatase/5'-nucleotidase [Candidatus Nanopelagicales bacterium]
MNSKRVLQAAGILTTASVLAALGATSATGAGSEEPTEPFQLQVLSFNDFHGNLRPPTGSSGSLGATVDPSNSLVGGVEYLSTKLSQLRAQSTYSITVAAGDLIGGAPFISQAFHNEPSIEAMNGVGLDVSSVGNHEFDAGITELLRMQKGGCGPDGCYFKDSPFKGAKFKYLAANVVNTKNKKTVLPATKVLIRNGVKIGLIGMTLEGTPQLVDQRGIKGYEFHNVVKTANAAAKKLNAAGVKAIIVLLHEGGAQTGTKDECLAASGPIVAIAEQMSSKIDMLVTGHTHQAYICQIPDPAGHPRLVTSASAFGRLVTDTRVWLDPATGDFIRSQATSKNVLVDRATADPAQTALIAKWAPLEGVIGDRIVGRIDQDIMPGRGQIESAMGNLVADAQLASTSPSAQGGAQINFMNPGGVRAGLTYAPGKFSTGLPEPEPGMVTHAEAFAVLPFGNTLLTMDLSGAEIQQLLEQQYVAGRAGGDRLILSPSLGFTFTWVDSAAAGSKVPDDSVKLNGVALDNAKTYRVSTNSFLGGGGDGFTVFQKGSNIVGGGVDLSALLDYMAKQPITKSPGIGRVTVG